MKKLLLAFALLLAASAVTFAATGCHTSPVMAEREITESIRNQIRYPAFLRESEGEHDATIIFKVSSCGAIDVQDIVADDEDLRADLMNQAPNIKVNAACLDARDTYRIVVKFKTL